MSGIFGRKKAKAAPVKEQTETEKIVERQEQRAEAQEISEMQGAQKRRRIIRSGGMRLLFSPLRQEGPGVAELKKKLGG